MTDKVVYRQSYVLMKNRNPEGIEILVQCSLVQHFNFPGICFQYSSLSFTDGIQHLLQEGAFRVKMSIKLRSPTAL